jgi:hypothetical protein
MKPVLFALLGMALSLPLYGEDDPVLRVDFSNPGLNPPQWTLVVHPDGSGHFHADSITKGVGDAEMIGPGKVDRDVNMSGSFATHLFEIVHHHRLLRENCESHMKVAFQGLKKISYTGPDGQGSCEFNYSKDKEIQGFGDELVAVGSTIIEGARLEMLLQHDPLGLDKAMDYITEAANDGRLQQFCTIRDTLQRLQDDPHVMDRVRKRARLLLARGDK